MVENETLTEWLNFTDINSSFGAEEQVMDFGMMKMIGVCDPELCRLNEAAHIIDSLTWIIFLLCLFILWLSYNLYKMKKEAKKCS